MTNPTTNRGFVMPASTDLVTDLPADFAVFGDAVDLDISSRGGYTTTVTAAGTTTLTIASNRNQRFTGTTTQTVVMPVASTLAVGARWIIQNKSTGIVTVNSSGGNAIYAIPANTTAEFVCVLASGTTAASWDYDWAGASTPPSAGLKLITRQSFSAVANTDTTFDNVFSSTYRNYIIEIEKIYCTTSMDDLLLQLRYAGPTTQAGTAYSQGGRTVDYSGTLATMNVNGGASFILNTSTGTSTYSTAGRIEANMVGNAAERPALTWQTFSAGNGIYAHGGGYIDSATNYLGFILSSASTNISGTVSVYGLAIA